MHRLRGARDVRPVAGLRLGLRGGDVLRAGGFSGARRLRLRRLGDQHGRQQHPGPAVDPRADGLRGAARLLHVLRPHQRRLYRRHHADRVGDPVPARERHLRQPVPDRRGGTRRVQRHPGDPGPQRPLSSRRATRHGGHLVCRHGRADPRLCGPAGGTRRPPRPGDRGDPGERGPGAAHRLRSAPLQAHRLHAGGGRRRPRRMPLRQLGRLHQPHRVRPADVGPGHHLRAGGGPRHPGRPDARRRADPGADHRRREPDGGGFQPRPRPRAGRLRPPRAPGIAAVARGAALRLWSGSAPPGLARRRTPSSRSARDDILRHRAAPAHRGAGRHHALRRRDRRGGCGLHPRRGRAALPHRPERRGKSTFFKILTGQLKPSEGRIRLRDTDITGAEPHAIARLGVGIKTQVPNVFNGLTVHENVFVPPGGASLPRAPAPSWKRHSRG